MTLKRTNFWKQPNNSDRPLLDIDGAFAALKTRNISPSTQFLKPFSKVCKWTRNEIVVL